MAKKKTFAKKKKSKKLVEKPTAKPIGIHLSELPYKVHCSFDEILKISDLNLNKDNPNQHPDTQIQLLASVMKYQGVRRPIKISTRSGLMTNGHCQLQAMSLNGWEYAPVDYQDYDDEAQEYADIVADNEIGRLSKTDKAMVNAEVMNLGPDFDLKMMGIPNFVIQPDIPEEGKPRDHGEGEGIEKLTFKLSVKLANLVREAIHRASEMIAHDDTEADKRGFALASLCERFLEDYPR